MNMKQNKLPTITFKEKPQYVNGFLCLAKGDEIRISFIEEKISQNIEGNIEITCDGSNQIVMTKKVAKSLAESILEELTNS